MNPAQGRSALATRNPPAPAASQAGAGISIEEGFVRASRDVAMRH